MTTKRTLIQLLKSDTFAIWIAMASVAVQSFHSFYAFYKISSLTETVWGIIQACLFAVIVDMAVLFYTVRKNTKVTWMAAFVMVIINVYVYYTHLGLGLDFIMAAIISLVIPVSVYFYSEEIGKNGEDDKIDINTAKLILDQMQSIHAQIVQTILVAPKPIPKYPFDGVEQTGNEAIINENGREIITNDMANLSHKDKSIIQTFDTPSMTKGFASLKSPSQPEDKSLLGVKPESNTIIKTDRPIR